VGYFIEGKLPEPVQAGNQLTVGKGRQIDEVKSKSE
jgi:hypothetical protein